MGSNPDDSSSATPKRKVSIPVIMFLAFTGFCGFATAMYGMISSSGGRFERYAATANTDNVWRVGLPPLYKKKTELSVWVATPFVSPGDSLVVEVGVYGGERAAIEEIDGSLGNSNFRHKGRGPQWSGTIEIHSSSSSGRDFEDLELVIPQNVKDGDVLPLEFNVRHTLAVGIPWGKYENVQATKSISVPIRVRSSREATILRLLSLAGVLLLLGMSCLISVWVFRGLRPLFVKPKSIKTSGPDSEIDQEKSWLQKIFTREILAAAVILPNSFVSVWVFSIVGCTVIIHCLRATLGSASVWISVGTIILWASAPALAVWYFRGPAVASPGDGGTAASSAGRT